METKFKITRMWAFTMVDPEDPSGDEGIPAIKLGDTAMPLVASDERRLKDLKPIAQDIADQKKAVVRLLEFTDMKEVERFYPNRTMDIL